MKRTIAEGIAAMGASGIGVGITLSNLEIWLRIVGAVVFIGSGVTTWIIAILRYRREHGKP